MKKILLFFMLSIMVTCTGQEPDVCFYTQELVDSLLGEKQKEIDATNELNRDLITINDSLNQRIWQLNDSIDKLGQNVSSNDSIFYGNKELKIMSSDSTEFDISLKKLNQDTWYSLSKGLDSIRVTYIQDTLKIWIGRDTVTTLYLGLYMPWVKLFDGTTWKHVCN